MLWFKRWYHERFVNHSSDSVTLALPADVKKRTKRKVIRIIYDGCDDDSIVCRHRNSYWFERRRLCNRSIDSIVDSIGVTNGNNNCDESAIEANTFDETVTQQQLELQVTDKSVEQSIIINDTRNTDIDSTEHLLYGQRAIFRRTNDSFVTDVNENGNGEYNSGSLSKSKDQRLRTCKLSIVSEYCCNICNPNQRTSFDVKECFDSDSNRIQIQYDSDGYADTDEWPPKSFQQIEFLQRRIKELEYFISEIENRVKSGSNNSKISNNNSTSGTNQAINGCQYCDEQPLTDWVIVSIELRSFTSCESFSDDDHFSSVEESSSFVQYYTTSEFSGKRTIVTVHQCPSNNLLNGQLRSYTASPSDYGIHDTHNCAVGRLLGICKFLDFNIQTGTPSIDSLATEFANTSTSCTRRSSTPTMKFTSILTPRRRDYHSTDSVYIKENPMYPEFNYLLQDPCSSSKHSNVLTAQVIHNSLSTISTIEPPKSPFKAPIKYSSTESIPEYFGLNECGDIIIHVDHICEETGFGFLVGRKKKIYCDVPYGEEVCEKPKFSLKYAVKRFFKVMSNTICKCTTATGELKVFERSVHHIYFSENSIDILHIQVLLIVTFVNNTHPFHVNSYELRCLY